MKRSILVLAIASLASVAVHAEDANPLSFNIGVFSDYRFRGISQTRLLPALQFGADYAFPSGFYVGTWLSTIRWIEDAGKAANVQVGSTSLEWDIYAGYKGEIAKDFSYDVGALAYYYPGNKLYNIPGSRNAHTGELYGALTFGPATVKYSHSVTTLFGFDHSRNSGYLEAAATPPSNRTRHALGKCARVVCDGRVRSTNLQCQPRLCSEGGDVSVVAVGGSGGPGEPDLWRLARRRSPLALRDDVAARRQWPAVSRLPLVQGRVA